MMAQIFAGKAIEKREKRAEFSDRPAGCDQRKFSSRVRNIAQGSERTYPGEEPAQARALRRADRAQLRKRGG